MKKYCKLLVKLICEHDCQVLNEFDDPYRHNESLPIKATYIIYIYTYIDTYLAQTYIYTIKKKSACLEHMPCL